MLLICARLGSRCYPETSGARDGQPVVGIDLGAGRAFSAAVAMWRSGRIEAMAVAPGIPDLASQERRDRVPAGTYAALVAGGALEIAHGLRVQPPGQLMAAITARWGQPDFHVLATVSAKTKCAMFPMWNLTPGLHALERIICRHSGVAADVSGRAAVRGGG